MERGAHRRVERHHYVEAHAALAHASRQNRLDPNSHRQAVAAFDALWADVAHIPVDETVLHSAAGLAALNALRGSDAVHCASAPAAASDDVFAVTGDRELLRAWSALGIAAIDALSPRWGCGSRR